MKTSFIFLAEGFEELEALTVIDILRRAEIPVKTVSITSSLLVTGAHGVTVKADLLFDPTHFGHCEWLILPGGMPGATNLYEFSPLAGLLRQHVADKGRVAAICASPAVVLGQLGLLRGRKATCYPGFEDMLDGALPVDAPVVAYSDLVLGNGPASAIAWALAIVAKTKDEKIANQVANGMLLYPRGHSQEDMDFYFG